MRNPVCALILVIITIFLVQCNSSLEQEEENETMSPGDWFLLERHSGNYESGQRSFKKVLQSVGENSAARVTAGGWNQSWLLEGPANTGGRFNCIAVNPNNTAIMYAGCASGGIFKTIDNGVSWTPVFDNQPWLAVSTIVFEPGNPDVIYAGTGDKNISITPFIGDGIYKSSDAGVTWTHLGLTDACIISKIVVDPLNTNNIYAAAMGLPFVRNNNRGVYKSSDGGLTWTTSLFVNDSTGAIDLLINPQNPQILYAATWNRIRNNHESLVVGPDAGIYRSVDGGLNWNLLSGGLPTGDMCRIGMTMSGTNPNILWAVYVDNTLDIQGIYKTTDGGINWNPVNNPGFGIMGGFGWYFGRIQVNPTNDNELWLCAVDIYKTTDGGINWSASFGTHSDNHDIIYKAIDNWVLATDGGLYETTDGGNSWTDIDLIPNNQFYRITYNPHVAGEYAGGVQDNGTNVGNASVINNWQKVFGADGFQIRYNPTDANIFYVEWQNGNINVTTDGGFSFTDATSGIDPSDRRSWDMPYILNTNNPDELYTGTYRIYKNSTGPAANWIAISPDLTDGVIFGDRFHTITAVDQSLVNNNHLMGGTSDGNVWYSINDGLNWNNVSASLPDQYVTSVHFSPNTQNLAYATHSGYKENEFIPHIHKTLDNGITWIDISGNLPQLAINDMYPYPGNDSILFVATDAGVYGTTDAGTTWNRLGNNMPAIAVFDLDHDPFNNKLLAGTFARSMWSYPIDSILVSSKINSSPLTFNLFPVPASNYIYVTGITVKDIKEMNIYSSEGKKSACAFTGNASLKADISSLKAGTYFMEVISRYGKSVKKFVKY
ncbi:MAG: T9SS type A sorting domain-containing protein [Bacteroidota bacterium]